MLLMATEVGDATARRALRDEPARLAQEIVEVQSAIQALSLANYSVHIANHKTERATREQLAAGSETIACIESTASAASARLEVLQPQLSRLHGSHASLRQTLLHHSAVVELLEAPSVMETCMRAGMIDEALDVAEFGSTLYFTHKLWLPPSPLQEATQPHASIVAQVVADIRIVANDLRESILSQLSGKLTLPLALRLLGHLRRLYTQQALARKRVHELQHKLQVDGHMEASRISTSPGSFSLTAAEDNDVVETLRAAFLACRDTWHRQELESIPRHNPQQYLLRVIDLQRSQWADIATQFLAVCHTVRTQLQVGRGLLEAQLQQAVPCPRQWEAFVTVIRIPTPLPPARKLHQHCSPRRTAQISTAAAVPLPTPHSQTGFVPA